MMCKGILVSKPAQILLPFDITELVEKDHPTILRPKLPTCRNTTRKQKPSKTTAVVSTSSEEGPKPYWNASCEAVNSALLLPIGIDSPGSAAKLYSSWSNKTVEKSWFSTKLFTAPRRNLLPTCSQFCMSFPIDCMDSGDAVIKSKEDRNLSHGGTEGHTP